MIVEVCTKCGSSNIRWTKSEDGDEDIFSIEHYHCDACGSDFTIVDPYTEEDRALMPDDEDFSDVHLPPEFEDDDE